MRSPEEVWDEIEDGFDSVTQWGISDDQRARVAALIRARDAEVRAETLAGFGWEGRTLDDGYSGWDGDDRGGHAVHKAATRQRRLVGPWEPVEP